MYKACVNSQQTWISCALEPRMVIPLSLSVFAFKTIVSPDTYPARPIRACAEMGPDLQHKSPSVFDLFFFTGNYVKSLILMK